MTSHRLWLCHHSKLWEFLRGWEYQTTLPVSWEICIYVKKPLLELDIEQTGSKLGKEYNKAVYCHPVYLKYKIYAEYFVWNNRMNEAQVGFKIAERNIKTLRYADGTTIMAEKKEELKSHFDERKMNGIWSHHLMANTWGNIGNNNSLYFLGLQSDEDGDWSHEIKRGLLPGRKAMTNTDKVLKSRDITLLIKVCLVEAMVFPVVMYGCESWTIKKTEHPTIDAFELWCWRRLLRVPWTTRRSNRLILKEMNPEHSLEYWCWSWNFNTLTTWCEDLTP